MQGLHQYWSSSFNYVPSTKDMKLYVRPYSFSEFEGHVCKKSSKMGWGFEKNEIITKKPADILPFFLKMFKASKGKLGANASVRANF